MACVRIGRALLAILVICGVAGAARAQVTIGNGGSATIAVDTTESGGVSMGENATLTVEGTLDTLGITATSRASPTITNNGTIAATASLTATNASGLTLTNNGSFAAAISAVGAINATISNATGASLSGNITLTNARNVTLSGAGSVTGAIAASGANNLSLTLAGTNNNRLGLTNNTGTLSVTNNAVVSAAWATLDASGVSGTFTLDNNAQIRATGGNRAVNLTSAAATMQIDNSGTLSSSGSYTVDFSGSASGQMQLTNSGTISTGTTHTSALRGTGFTGNTTITNSGTISAGAQGAVMLMSARGNLSIGNNTSSARIAAGQGNTINFSSATGDLSLTNAGTVSTATNRAINATSTTGDVTVSNSGTISASGATLDMASLTGSASITNSGNITSSGNDAIDLENASSGTYQITNSGTISASLARAINLRNGTGNVTLNNNSGGVISGGGAHVVDLNMLTGAVAITNAGTLRTATASAHDYAVRADNITASFALTNSGTISASGSNGVSVRDTVASDSRSIDGVTIANSGTISAQTNVAIGASDISGDVRLANSGTIRAISGTDAFAAFGASGVAAISNSGTISAGGQRALDLTETIGNVSITNLANAAIRAGTGGDANYAIKAEDLDGDFTLSNARGAVIAASGDKAVSIADTAVSDAVTLGSITVSNSGTISAGGTHAFTANNARGAVSLTNSGTISAANATAFAATVTSGAVSVGNSGTISAGGNYGLNLNQAGGNVTINNGTQTARIESGANGGAADFAISADDIGGNFTLTNVGQIVADRSFAVAARDVSSTDARALRNVSLTNSGQILARTSDAFVSDNAAGHLLVTNSGSIISELGANALVATDLLGSADITNSGTISAGGASALDVSGADGNVEIDNETDGLISAGVRVNGDYGINANDIDGTFTLANNARILASGNYGVSVRDTDTTDSVTIEDVVIANSGTISGGGKALAVDHAGGDLNLVNTGTLRTLTGDEALLATNMGGDVIILNAAASTISAQNNRAINSGTVRGSFTLANLGTIAALTGGHGVVATNVSGDVSVTNAANAEISVRTQTALNLMNASGRLTLSNAGTIEVATGNEIANLSSAGGNLSITNSGIMRAVSGANGIIALSAGERVSLSNSGTISVGGQRAVDLSGARGAVSVINSSAARILAGTATAADFALKIDNADDNVSITNASIIAAQRDYGVAVRDLTLSDTVVSGNLSLVNLGSISATRNYAAALTHAGGSVNVTNGGTISAGGTHALDMSAAIGDVVLTNQIGSTIRNGQEVEADYAVLADNLDGNFTLSNASLITSRRDYGLSVRDTNSGDSITIEDVSLTNSGNILAGRDNAVRVEEINGAFELENDGVIWAVGARGLFVDGVGDTARVVNSGRILSGATRAASLDEVSGAVAFTNSGDITAATEYALTIDSAGSDVRLTNSGTISATAAHGVSINMAVGEVEVVNLGRVSSEHSAMRLSSSGDAVILTNSGAISATAHTALSMRGSSDGARLINRGTISAESDWAVLADSVSNGVVIDNSGQIISGNNLAINLDNSAGVVTDGISSLRLTNSGDITSGGTIIVSAQNAANLHLTNSGVMYAEGALGLRLTGGDARLTNDGRISAETVTVMIGSDSLVTNRGTITARGEDGIAISVSGDDNIIDLAEGSVVNGRIVASSGTSNNIIRLTVGEAYSYAFGFEGFAVEDRDTRPVHGTSAHGSGVALLLAADGLMARRSLTQTHAYVSNIGKHEQRYWIRPYSASGVRDSDGLEYAENTAGLMVGNRFELFTRPLDLLLVQESRKLSVSKGAHDLESRYSGMAIALPRLLKLGDTNLSGYFSLGTANNRTQRNVLNNLVSSGTERVSGRYDSQHSDMHLKLTTTSRATRNAYLYLGAQIGRATERREAYTEQRYFSSAAHHMRQDYYRVEIGARYTTPQRLRERVREYDFNILAQNHELVTGDMHMVGVRGVNSSYRVANPTSGVVNVSFSTRHEYRRDLFLGVNLSLLQGSDDFNTQHIALTLSAKL